MIVAPPTVSPEPGAVTVADGEVPSEAVVKFHVVLFEIPAYTLFAASTKVPESILM